MGTSAERESLFRHRVYILHCLKRIESHLQHLVEQKKIYLDALQVDEEDLMLLSKVKIHARIPV